MFTFDDALAARRTAPTYSVNLVFSPEIVFPNVCVAQMKARDVAVVIGMDIIAQGDLLVAQDIDGATVCAFQYPPARCTDAESK